MHVVIDPTGVTLEHPDDFQRFDVLRRGEVDVAAAVAEHRWGTVDSSGDVMVSIDRLRQAGPDDRNWHEGLDKMVQYARSKGWLSPDGTHIQAHVVEDPQP